MTSQYERSFRESLDRIDLLGLQYKGFDCKEFQELQFGFRRS